MIYFSDNNNPTKNAALCALICTFPLSVHELYPRCERRLIICLHFTYSPTFKPFVKVKLNSTTMCNVSQGNQQHTQVILLQVHAVITKVDVEVANKFHAPGQSTTTGTEPSVLAQE